MKKAEIALRAALLCDDIRREASGKLLLVGTYSGDLLVATIPAVIPLCVLLLAPIARPGRARLEFRFMGGETMLAAGDFSADAAVEDPGALLPLGPFPVPLQTNGPLHFEVRHEAGEWARLGTWRVGLAPQPSA